MKRTLVVAAAISVIVLFQGCASYPARLAKDDGADTESIWRISDTAVMTHRLSLYALVNAGFVDSHSVSAWPRNNTEYYCNYYVNDKCKPNNYGYALYFSPSNVYSNLYDYEFGGKYGEDVWKDAYRGGLDNGLNGSLKAGTTKYKIIVRGISTNQQVVVYPEALYDEKNNSVRLGVVQALRGKLQLDPAGYVITGQASIVVPERFIIEKKDYGARIVLPLNLGGRDKDRESEYYLAFRKSNAIGYFPDKITTTYFGTVVGFRLKDKIAEYTGMIDAEVLAELSKKQEQFIEDTKRKKREAAEAFAMSKERMRLAIERDGKGEALQNYADVKEVCDSLRKGRWDAERVSCDYDKRDYPGVRDVCTKRKREFVYAVERDESRNCSDESDLKRRLGKYFAENDAVASGIVEDAKDNNDITWNKLTSVFPYLEYSLGNEISEYATEAHKQMVADAVAWVKGKPADLNEMRQRLLAPMPGAATVNQFNQNMKAYVENQKKIDADYEQQKRDYRASLLGGTSSRGSSTSSRTSTSTSANTQSSQSKTASSNSTYASKQSSQTMASSKSAGSPSNHGGQGDCYGSSSSHKLPVITVEGRATNAYRELDKRKKDYMESVCGAYGVSSWNGPDGSREVLKAKTKGTAEQDYIRLTTNSEYSFSCGCGAGKPSRGQAGSGSAK